jgi:hypothetical protein
LFYSFAYLQFIHQNLFYSLTVFQFYSLFTNTCFTFDSSKLVL